jgi:hypothetical protein
MARPHTIRLREVKGAAPAPADRVIDARFKEIGASRRSLWGRFKLAAMAVLCAAAIGFLIPPLWLLAQRIAEQFAP